MKKQFSDLSINLQSRGFTADDITSLRAHARATREAAHTAERLKDMEHVIVFATVAELYKKYPEKANAYVECDTKTLRDMKLVMRYCMYSVVLDDPEYANQKMFWWFRTILNAFEFGREFIEDAYRMAQKRVNQHLPPNDAAKISHMIDVAIDTFNFEPLAETTTVGAGQ